MQELVNKNRIAPKLISLRPVGNEQNIEQVTVRLENVYYAEMIHVIVDIERYSNLWIKSLTFKPRYDNEKLIDINMEVVKF